MLSELLASVITDSGVIPDDDKELPAQLLPQHSDQIKYYDIHGWNVGNTYNPTTEVIILDLDSRTEYSHLFTLPIDVSEFNILDDGKYKEAVFDLLVKYGLHS
jgi:hypothetical protein